MGILKPRDRSAGAGAGEAQRISAGEVAPAFGALHLAEDREQPARHGVSGVPDR